MVDTNYVEFYIIIESLIASILGQIIDGYVLMNHSDTFMGISGTAY